MPVVACRSYVPVPPAEMMSPPTSAWAARSFSIAAATSSRWRDAVLQGHEVALVAHDAAHREAHGAGVVGETTGVGGVAAAAGEADVDVDDALAQASQCRRGDRLVAVDGDRDAGPVAERAQGFEAAGIDDLVGDEQVVAQPGRRHADGFSRRGARERRVAGIALAGGDGGALVRLDVRAQRGTGVGRSHRGQVGVERVDVDDHRRCRQVVHVHRPPSVARSLIEPPPA